MPGICGERGKKTIGNCTTSVTCRPWNKRTQNVELGTCVLLALERARPRAWVRLVFLVRFVVLVFFGGRRGEVGLARRGRRGRRRRRRRIRRWCWCWRWAICTYRTGQPICLPSSSPCWYPARSNTFLALVTYVSRCMSACPPSPLLSSSLLSGFFSDLLLFGDVYNSLPPHTLLFSMVFPYRSTFIFRVEYNCVCLASLIVILKFCWMIVGVFQRVSLLHVLVFRIAMIFLVKLFLSRFICF